MAAVLPVGRREDKGFVAEATVERYGLACRPTGGRLFPARLASDDCCGLEGRVIESSSIAVYIERLTTTWPP